MACTRFISGVVVRAERTSANSGSGQEIPDARRSSGLRSEALSRRAGLAGAVDGGPSRCRIGADDVSATGRHGLANESSDGQQHHRIVAAAIRHCPDLGTGAGHGIGSQRVGQRGWTPVYLGAARFRLPRGQGRCGAGGSRSGSPPGRRMSRPDRSAPTQKYGPLPLTTTPPTASVRSHQARAALMSSLIWSVHALRSRGRLSKTVATPPSRRTSMVSSSGGRTVTGRPECRIPAVPLDPRWPP